MGDLVPRETLVKQGMQGFGALGGGVGLLLLKGLSGIPIVGLVVAGVVTLVGLAMGISREDRAAGLVAVGAGILTGLAAFFGPLGGLLMSFAGWGLIAGAGYKLFTFWRNLRKRM